MVGLLISAVMSVFNVFTDISRKKVLDTKVDERQFDATLISFWCKFVALFAYIIGLAVLFALGTSPQLPDIAKSKIAQATGLTPVTGFLVYVVLCTFIEGTAIWLNLRALQVSPISLCTPFMAMTPLFLLPAGKFLLGESIAVGMVLGVCLVVVGALVVNRQLFAHGLMEPAKAMLRERGPRYMLLVALLLTFTNVLDKWFATGGKAELNVQLARSFTMSMGKCVTLGMFFVGLLFVQRAAKKTATPVEWTLVWNSVPGWMLLAGVFESIVMVLQLLAMQLAPAAALVISIKRSGIVLAVFLGWWIFRERGITDRVIAACVMLSGVLIFSLTQPNRDTGIAILDTTGACVVFAGALGGMAIALYLTRNHYKPAQTPQTVVPVKEEASRKA